MSTAPEVAACTHPLRTSVADFIHGLRELERDLITKDKIAAYMGATTLRPEALHDYTWWRDSFYTRNLIYRDDLFEVMTICWSPGQKTAIHTHNGQLGWMTVSQGEVLTTSTTTPAAMPLRTRTSSTSTVSAAPPSCSSTRFAPCRPPKAPVSSPSTSSRPSTRLRTQEPRAASACTSTPGPSTPASPSILRSSAATAAS